MLFGVLSGVADVITHAKFCVNRLRGNEGFLRGSTSNSVISYTFSNDPYTTVLHYRAACDQ